MRLLASVGSQPVRRMVQLRAKPGASLLASIEEAVAVEEIQAGVIVSGLGALERAVFRNLKRVPQHFPVTPEDRLYLEIRRPMELVSLTGWVAPKVGGGVAVHAHFSASLVRDDSVVTLGGHLNRDTICGIKVVVAILEIEAQEVRAVIDPGTQTHDILLGPLEA